MTGENQQGQEGERTEIAETVDFHGDPHFGSGGSSRVQVTLQPLARFFNPRALF
jgi:hypothetical protein